MDIFLLLSHLAANYFKTHDENSNLHSAWNSWRTEIMESGNNFFVFFALFEWLAWSRLPWLWKISFIVREIMIEDADVENFDEAVLYWPRSIFNLNKPESLLCYFKSNQKYPVILADHHLT